MSVAIRVERLSKRYRLGVIGGRTLREDLQRWWAGVRGREDPLLKVDAHGRQGDKIWALRDITFDVAEGEILGLIGENGAGKSTLLKVLTRITAPTSGRALMKGRVSSLLEVGTGFHPELTGRENVYLNGAILGMTAAEVDRKFDEIVAFSEVGPFIDTPVKRYSSGMRVRLAFAVAAHLEPEILLVDEVLAVGDAGFQKKCLGKMSEVARGGRTIIFVSHSMSSIRRLCTRAILLQGGRLQEDGESGQVVEAYFRALERRTTVEKGLPPGYLYLTGEELDEGAGAVCRITGIQLLDEDGEPTDMVRTWDPVRFRIFYEMGESLARAAVTFMVSTQGGTVLSLLSTQHEPTIPEGIDAGRGSVDLVIPCLPYSAGSYMLGAGIAFPGVSHLWREDRLCELRIHERDVFDCGQPPLVTHQAVATPHRWQSSSGSVVEPAWQSS